MTSLDLTPTEQRVSRPRQETAPGFVDCYRREAASHSAAASAGSTLYEPIAAGEAVIQVGRAYRMDDVVQAHHEVEAEVVGGKAVEVP